MAMPAAAPLTAARRVAIVAPSGASMREREGHLLGEIAARRHRILAVAPEFTDTDAGVLDEMGAERAPFAAEPHALKLFSDWKAIGALKAILAEWGPHVVLGCGARSMIYAALAAKAAGVERVVLLFGALPQYRFAGELAPDEMPAWRYAQALRAADAAVFHNRDDIALLERLALLPPNLPTTVVAGAGIDLKAHVLQPLPPLGDGLVFLMIGAARQAQRCHRVLPGCRGAARARAQHALPARRRPRRGLVGPAARGSFRARLGGRVSGPR